MTLFGKARAEAHREPRPGVTRAEKRKLVLLALGLVLTILAFAYARSVARAPRANVDPELPAAPTQPEESVFVPEIDAARLETLVADREPVDRVALESAAVDELLAVARALTPRHYEELGAAELTAERCAALRADPASARGKAFFARGRIDSIRSRTREGASTEHIGRLSLEDGGVAYFLVLDAPEEAGFVRVDGLFLKAYSAESDLEPGVWHEGPLLVGARAVRSYADLGPVEAPHWELYATIPDADLAPADGSEPRFMRECPFEPYWHLMAYARDLPQGSIPWEEAPELDERLVSELLHDPATWRAQPVRVPVSRIVGVEVRRVGENPARIDALTDGWLGKDTWRNVVHFQAPRALPELAREDLVEGRGFFLHVAAYESQGKGLRVAPVVVLHSLAEFVPPERESLLRLMLGVSLAFIASIGLFAWLLFRDRRRSREFEQELVRRRRARQGSLPSSS
jgi:hypothetical protein